jgi:hypothetical protein
MSEKSEDRNLAELERVLKIMEPYIQSCPLYDVVHSDKFGYLLIAMPSAEVIDDAEVIQLECAEMLLHELFTNLCYDFMEQEGHCVDYTEATALELRELRVWIRPFLDQLPEYQHILDEILSEKE